MAMTTPDDKLDALIDEIDELDPRTCDKYHEESSCGSCENWERMITAVRAAALAYGRAVAIAAVEAIPCPLDLPGTRQFVGGAKDIHGNCERAGVPCSSFRCRRLAELRQEVKA